MKSENSQTYPIKKEVSVLPGRVGRLGLAAEQEERTFLGGGDVLYLDWVPGYMDV